MKFRNFNVISACFFNKKGLIFLSFIYLISYLIFYDEYLSLYFSYMRGVIRGGLDFYDTCLFYIFGLLPIFFYRGFRTLASGISFMVFLFIYIPCIHAAFITPLNSINNKTLIILTLCCSMISFFVTDGLYLGKSFFINIKPILSFKSLLIITIVLISVNLAFNLKYFKFVNFFKEDTNVLYDLRSASAEGRFIFLNYLTHWLKEGLMPVCLVYGLVSRNRCVVVSMFVGYIIMFMTDFQKITFLMPFIMTSFYYAISSKLNYLKYRLGNGILLICLCLGWIIYLFSDTAFGFGLSAIFLLRTLLCEDWLMSMYMSFFEKEPFTYFTHINIINFFSQSYPFKRGLGEAVTGGEFNANACFLITDGYASMGCVGVIIITLFFIFFKALYNSVTIQYNKTYIFLLLIPAIVALLNVSLFTAILTAGFGIIYLILLTIRLPYLKNKTNGKTLRNI